LATPAHHKSGIRRAAGDLGLDLGKEFGRPAFDCKVVFQSGLLRSLRLEVEGVHAIFQARIYGSIGQGQLMEETRRTSGHQSEC
jgi:hypothetical protein